MSISKRTLHPLATSLIAGCFLLLSGCSGGGNSNAGDSGGTGGNNTPVVASATGPSTVDTGTTVTLDASASTGPSGLAYSWIIVSHPASSTAALANSSSSKPTFVPDKVGTYEFSVTVSAGGNASTANATVNARLPNAGPTANAGADGSSYVGSAVQLSAAASSDPEGDSLTYRWTLSAPNGSSSSLANTNQVSTSFVPDVAGVYTATLVVNDGKVDSAADSVQITAAISAWATAPAMPTARDNAVVVAVGSDVYVMGGSVSGTQVGTVEVFNTVSGTWRASPSMPQARVGFAGVAAGGKIYTIGGGQQANAATGAPATIVANVDRFDPGTQNWVALPPLPLPARTFSTAAASGNFLYVIGGDTDASNCLDWPCHVLATVAAYDINANTWSVRADIPRSTYAATAVTLGSKIYTVGGIRQAGNTIGRPSTDTDEYDSVANAWSAKAKVPEPLGVANHGAAVVNNTIVVLGNSGTPTSAWTFLYDTTTDTWAEKPAPAAPGWQGAAAVGGKVYAFTATQTLVYDPTLDP